MLISYDRTRLVGTRTCSAFYVITKYIYIIKYKLKQRIRNKGKMKITLLSAYLMYVNVTSRMENKIMVNNWGN